MGSFDQRIPRCKLHQLNGSYDRIALSAISAALVRQRQNCFPPQKRGARHVSGHGGWQMAVGCLTYEASLMRLEPSHVVTFRMGQLGLLLVSGRTSGRADAAATTEACKANLECSLVSFH